MELQLKLYDFKGTFKKQINPRDVFNDISFQEENNGGQGDLTLSINGLLADYSTSDIIEIRNSVKGDLYTGIIESIDVVEFEEATTLHITLYGVFSALNDVIFKSVGVKTFTKTGTVGVIIKSIIDSFNLDYGVLFGDTQILQTNLLRYTPASVDITGATISIDFANDNCINAIKKVIKDTNFEFFIGADGIINVIQKVNQTNNIITFEKEIVSITRNITKKDMINKYYLTRNGGTEITYEDVVEQGVKGIKETYLSDTNILDLATQNIKGNTYISKFKTDDDIVIITIKPSYNYIPGQTITTLNSTNNLVGKTITKINIQPTYTELYLGNFLSFGKEIAKLSGKVL